MMSVLPFLMFAGLLPFFLLPAILAWASKRPNRGVVLGANIAYLVVGLVMAMGGVLGAALALVAWLGLLVWSLHPPKPTEPGAPKFEITD